MASPERRRTIINMMEGLPHDEVVEYMHRWRERLEDGLCPLCGQNPGIEFRDEKSRQEFEQSHICQACQDEVFDDE